MLLTRNACYALIAVSHLADERASCDSARGLAAANGIPQEMLAKVLQRLARAGLLVPHYGVRGGHALARDADEIPVLEVIRASGPKRESSHREYSNHLRFVYDTIEALLRQLTVGELQRFCSVVPRSHFSSDLFSSEGQNVPSQQSRELRDSKSK
jgi:Rrf2 family protein